MADKKTDKKPIVAEEASAKKKGFKTKDVIVLMIVVSVIVAAILVAVNFISGSSNKKQEGVSADRVFNEVSDTIKAMIRGADLEVKYINSDKRTVLYCIGSSAYYGIRFLPEKQLMYTFEGTYTSKATTDELKISEAESKLSNGSYGTYATGVTNFNVSNANGNGGFDDGVVKLILAISNEEGVKRAEFSEKIPGAQAAE